MARRRVAVLPDGSECSRASLTEDGDRTQKWHDQPKLFTSDGKPLNRSDMVGIDHDGNLVEQKPLLWESSNHNRVSGFVSSTATISGNNFFPRAA